MLKIIFKKIYIMDTYLYKYKCPTWWGSVSGFKNINVTTNLSEKEVVQKAIKLEEVNNGYTSCSVDLLQKYRVSIQNIKNYSALTSIPLNINVNEDISGNKSQL